MFKYIKYKLHSDQKIRISDDSMSKQGQTMSLYYIPGSSIRGIMISNIAGDKVKFESLKQSLFSDDICFSNLYLLSGQDELIPSPKGFYEDKKQSFTGKKEIQNVVISGEFEEGFKRAGLGNYCKWNGDTIEFYSTIMDSDLKIRLNHNEEFSVREGKSANSKPMFRYLYMKAGQDYYGYIVFKKDSAYDEIKSLLDNGTLIIGNSRSSGTGKCSVYDVVETEQESEIIPQYDRLPKSDVKNTVYMYLFSDLVMRNENGEYCGINICDLERKLKVSDLKIEVCATSSRDVRGYNNTLKVRMPSVNMYEKGSVFKLSFSGTLTRDTIESLVVEGIGERRNEGYGRILFFDDSYGEIKYKQKGEITDECDPDSNERHKEDDDVLRQVAASYYRNHLRRLMIKRVIDDANNIGKDLSKSKSGSIEPLIISNMHNFENAAKQLEAYYGHEKEKHDNTKIHKERNNVKNSKELVYDIMNSDINILLGYTKTDIMGIDIKDLLSEAEVGRLRLELILMELKYSRKGE